MGYITDNGKVMATVIGIQVTSLYKKIINALKSEVRKQKRISLELLFGCSKMQIIKERFDQTMKKHYLNTPTICFQHTDSEQSIFS